jgi:hypothetical protein
MNNNEEFGLLFATPSFLEGAARSLDLGDTITEYNSSRTPSEADFLGLRSDWRAVGEDFDAVLSAYTGKERE